MLVIRAIGIALITHVLVSCARCSGGGDSWIGSDVDEQIFYLIVDGLKDHPADDLPTFVARLRARSDIPLTTDRRVRAYAICPDIVKWRDRGKFSDDIALVALPKIGPPEWGLSFGRSYRKLRPDERERFLSTPIAYPGCKE